MTGAAAWGHADIVRELLTHGADPNLREDHGTGLSPLEWAAPRRPHRTEALLKAASATPPQTPCR
ncbi:hypothetical protein [Micromonospora haikouensis]|uniref:hypothetical protein n=1 Tax=Micromonospora haikouensis TaxID=686309 RepID=UPI003D92AE01